jgi:hypothetical protein
MKYRIQNASKQYFVNRNMKFFYLPTDYVSMKFSNKFISDIRSIFSGGFDNEKVTYS